MEKGGTAIEIFGATYHVRGEKDAGYLRELAAVVDRKMREVSGQMKAPDAARVAIQAALNLADELHQCQRRQERERVEIQEKVAELAGELTDALQG
jgi:cell division protein ZapA